MILFLDTSTPVCKVELLDGDKATLSEWQADRMLAKDMHGHLREQLDSLGKTWQDISAIGVFEGPGSFTGLRIGLTVANTLADSLHVPIVGATGENWRDVAVKLITNGENHQMVLPEYASEANITKPRK